ncbi:MAG: DUF3179 domain-containing protein, partial [Gammaproteobacteria bacterium]|nr:DUF3179 domain-containing protein [Gammaproteobacteria bacterium]
IQRAYPVRILNYHEIVNDRFGSASVTISWCPLCGSGMAFSARVNDKPVKFGVSGLLYNSDMLLYDRQTNSLWSQLLHKAISGPLKGNVLKMLPVQHTSWGDWRERYPQTVLLSQDTGFSRDYSRTPYPGYSKLDGVYFPLAYVSRRYHPKEQVAGLEINGHFKAYPFIELNKHEGDVLDNVGGSSLRVVFDQKHGRVQVFSDNGNEIPVVISFWFAWYAFHPDTEVFTAVNKLK